MNYYREYADKANELGMNIHDFTQLNEVAKHVSSDCYKYIRGQVVSLGIPHVVKMIKNEI